jgi:hypothetical protein
MSEDATATSFNVRSNDTLDIDHTAANSISIGTVSASGPAGDGITGADVTTAVVGNQVQITLGADFQNLGAGETATIAVPYTLTGDQPGDTDGATLTVTVNGANDAPVAGDFTFNGANAAIGNTALVVNDASDGAPDPVGLQKTITGDLLAGATDVDTPATSLTITAQTINNTSGTLIIEADGDFTYLPTAGFTGNAVFSYTLNDNDPSGNLTDTGTVTIEVAAPKVWYVDDSAAAGGDGTSDSPFDLLADVSGAAGADQAGDIIYLFEGNYAGGITLLDNQTLWGAGTALTVNGTTLAAAGTDPVISNAAGSGVTVEQGNTLTGFTVGNTTGFDIANTAAASVGTLNVSNVTLNGSGGLFRADAGGTLNVQLDSATTSNAGATGILLSNVDNSSFSVTGVTTINDATTDGISVADSQNSTFTFGGLVTILNDAASANGDGVDLQNNNAPPTDSTFNFSGGVDITVNGNNAFGFRAQSSGTVNISDPGGVTTQITSNNGTALLINPTTLNATFDSITSTRDSGNNGGISLSGMSGSLTIGTVDLDGQDGDGIDITNSAGSVTINGGSIGATNDPAGIGVDVNGGTGNVTIGATITDLTAAGDVVEVTGRTGGTVDFNGLITSTNGGGIDINTNTGGTVRFDGGMNLNTGANIAFNASGNTNTTVVVSDTISTSNILTTTTGTALNVANTTIGSEDLTFQSISSNGGSAAGIILDNTGSSGGLHVTGTGTAGSGGTIANKSGADVSTLNTDGTANITGSSGIGILARNTVDLQLARMQLNDFSNFALIGQNVVGFSLTDSVINGTNGSNDAIDEGSVTFDNLRGTATISNTTITGGFEEKVSIQNTTNTGGPLNMTVSGSTFATSAGSLANDAFQFIADGNSVMNLTLQNSTFTTARGDLIHVVSRGATSSIDVNFTGNTLSNNHSSILSGGGGATFEADNQVSNSVLTFDILNNTFRDAVGVALNVFKGPGGGTVSGTISGNTIGVAGVDLSGSSQAGGINVDMDGGGTVTVAITNNTIQEYNADGIHLNIGSALGGNDGTFNATVTGNTTIAGAGAEPGGFASNGFEINAGTNSTGGTPSGPDNHVVNLKLSGNNFVDGGNASLFEDDVNLRDRFSVRVNLTGYTGASNDATAIATYVAGQNPGGETVTVSSLSGDGFFNTSPAGSDPPQPPVTPLLAADGGVDLPDGSVPGDALTNDALVTLTGAAVARWVAAGVSAEQIATLNGTSITVADLGGAELGHYANGQIVIDVDAAGHGWFIDATPNDDVEFGHLLSATQLQTDPTGRRPATWTCSPC